MSDALLAVDLGTRGVKAGVVGVDGVLASLAERSYPLLEGAGRGWFEQDPRAWWSGAREAMREAVAQARASRVVGLCVGGQGPSIVPVDEAGEPCANAIIWMDRRTEAERAAMSARLGSEVSPFSGVPMAMWLRVHAPDAYARTRWFLQAWDFIAFRLTGVAVASSFAAAPVFPPELVDAAGCDPAKFPPEVLMGSAVATLRPAVARDLGLAPEVVVAGGVNDSTAAVLGAALVRKGLALDLGGTSGGIALAWDRPLDGHGLTAWPAPTPGLFVCGGPLASGGRALEWVMSLTGYASDAYADVEADASRAPAGADGLVFLPYLAGERTPIWDDRARGVFFGLTERHTRAHLVRATLEGVALALRHIADTLRGEGGIVDELRVTGGQARVHLWDRIKADVLGVPVSVPAVTESAILGEAVLAAAGAGRAPDLATAAVHLAKEAVRFSPDPANAAPYDTAYRTYRELYPRLHDLMRGDA